MAGENTVVTLNGNFKERYADKIENLVPEGVKLMNMLPFVSAEKENGNKYNQPVILSQEHGFTYAAASSGAFSLNSAIAANLKNAEVVGSQLLLRSALDYEAAARASKGDKAFKKSIDVMVENMVNSFAKRIEIQLLYGQSGLGVVASYSGASITLTAASWAVGIWSGMENAKIDVYTGGTKQNTSDVVIESVDVANKKITHVAGATFSSSPTSGDVIYFKGAKGTEFAGLDAIITNTGSIFGIDASVYSLWKGNSFPVGGNLTFSKIMQGLALAVGRGLEEKVVLMVSQATWATMISDVAALRKFDSSYESREAKNGSQSIKFFGQNGEVEIIPSIHIKEGEAFAFPPKRLKRLGATDITFKMPDRGEEYFLHLPDAAGYELRAYSNMALFIEHPAKCVKFTGITNS